MIDKPFRDGACDIQRIACAMVIVIGSFVATSESSSEPWRLAATSSQGTRSPALTDSTSAPDVRGDYAINEGPGRIRVERLFGDFLRLTSSEGWEGIGVIDGTIYRGFFHDRGSKARHSAKGDHLIVWSPNDTMSFRTTFGSVDPIIQYLRRLGSTEAPWVTGHAEFDSFPKTLQPSDPPRLVGTTIIEDIDDLRGMPEEWPIAVKRVAPRDPGMPPGVEGTVIVLSLVLEDGTVGETRIAKSIPMLDKAAVECARQWRFKPAMKRGVPVPTWFAIPVRFTGH